MPTIVDLTVSSPTRAEAQSPKAALQAAILDAQPSRLRLVMQQICDSSADASGIAQRLLLVPEDEAKREMVERDNTDGEGGHHNVDDDDEDDERGEGDDGSSGDSSSGENAGGQIQRNCSSSLKDVTITPPSELKRLRSRYATCMNCSEEFDVTQNEENDCVWHSGEREADYNSDVWADHDERCHGRIDDLKDEYPEGFIYDCCDRDGTSEGCRIGTHVEVEVFSKRPRS